MKKLAAHSLWLLLLVCAAIVLGVCGCSTAVPENTSSRPWNAPQAWETGGLPSSMNEGR